MVKIHVDPEALAITDDPEFADIQKSKDQTASFSSEQDDPEFADIQKSKDQTASFSSEQDHVEVIDNGSALKTFVEDAFRIVTRGSSDLFVDPLKEFCIQECSPVPAGPPSRPNIDSVSPNVIKISWEKLIDDRGGEIEGYVVEVKPKDGDWSEAFPFEVKETECTVPNLKEGQEYQFRVRAVNAAGPGEPSLPTNPIVAEKPAEKPSLDLSRLKDITTDNETCHPQLTNPSGSAEGTVNVIVLNRPSPPQGPFKALKTSPKTITLQWEPSKDSVGSKLQKYVLLMKQKGWKKWLKVPGIIPPTETQGTAKNLEPGEEYDFRVMAVNENRESEPLETSESIKAKYPFDPSKEESLPWKSPDKENIVDKQENGAKKLTKLQPGNVSVPSKNIVSIFNQYLQKISLKGVILTLLFVIFGLCLYAVTTNGLGLGLARGDRVGDPEKRGRGVLESGGYPGHRRQRSERSQRSIASSGLILEASVGKSIDFTFPHPPNNSRTGKLCDFKIFRETITPDNTCYYSLKNRSYSHCLLGGVNFKRTNNGITVSFQNLTSRDTSAYIIHRNDICGGDILIQLIVSEPNVTATPNTAPVIASSATDSHGCLKILVPVVLVLLLQLLQVY